MKAVHSNRWQSLWATFPGLSESCIPARNALPCMSAQMMKHRLMQHLLEGAQATSPAEGAAEGQAAQVARGCALPAEHPASASFLHSRGTEVSLPAESYAISHRILLLGVERGRCTWNYIILARTRKWPLQSAEEPLHPRLTTVRS